MKCITALVAYIFALTLQAADPPLAAKRVATGLWRPVFVCAPSGDTNRLFILEQWSGQIRILNLSNFTLNATPFLQISGLTTGNEQGLLGMAFHPGYATNGFFYLNFTTSGGGAAGHTEVARYTVSTNPNVATLASKKLLLSINQPESNHNAGWLDFGPDGYLYISSGDGGGGDDRHGTIGNSQDRNSLLGKMLRIDVDGGDPYAIPDGNPFKGDTTKKQEIWHYGLRNPWRCSFDRATGDLWIADVGQNTREEINFAPAGVGGINFGWRSREGFIQNPNYDGLPYTLENPVSTARDPVHDYARTLGVSVTGGYRYRGSSIGGLQGAYIFADYGSARFWTFHLADGVMTNLLERTSEIRPASPTIGSISSFGEDGLGEIYFCDLNRSNLFKIVSAQPVLTNFSRTATQVNFMFEGFAGRTYSVESVNPLSGTNWSLLTTRTTATFNANFSISDTLSSTGRFYRVRGN